MLDTYKQVVVNQYETVLAGLNFCIDRCPDALEIFDNRSGAEPYDVSAVICPCRRGSIAVDGVPLRGEVRVPSGESASSAFLAFSETWVAREG